MWGFVGRKRSTRWIRAALDAETRQAVAVVAGDRSEATARHLWEAAPEEYRGGATVYTDFRLAYQAAPQVPATWPAAGAMA